MNEKSRLAVTMSLRDLLMQHGLGLLDSPLRIDAFLRDLHPDDPRDVFLLVETLRSGVLQKMRAGKPHLDAELHGFAAQLTAKSGVAPNFARWAVQAWVETLPDEAFCVASETEKPLEQSLWLGSIDEILGG